MSLGQDIDNNYQNQQEFGQPQQQMQDQLNLNDTCGTNRSYQTQEHITLYKQSQQESKKSYNDQDQCQKMQSKISAQTIKKVQEQNSGEIYKQEENKQNEKFRDCQVITEDGHFNSSTQSSEDLEIDQKQLKIFYLSDTISKKQMKKNQKMMKQNDLQYQKPSTPYELIKQKFQEDSPKFEDIQTLFKINECTMSRYLTKGGQAHVIEGTYKDQKQKKEQCVFKIYIPADQQMVEEEVKILKLLNNSQNTVKLLSYFFNQEKGIYILVLNKCQYSLEEEINILKNTGSNFTFNELCFIISNLIEGVIELRMYKVIHLDIKPGNILKTYDNKYIYSDFGISCRVQEGTTIISKGYTIQYSSPEQKDRDIITYLSDVYSLGITIKKLIKFYQDQIKYSTQKDIYCEQQQQQLELLLNLIEEKMLKLNCTEREECINLLFQYYEIIGKRNLQMQLYFKQQIRQFPFIQDIENKDSKFMNTILLKYQLLKLQMYIDQYKLSIKMEDFENLKSEEILNQVILHRDINKLKYLRLVTIISSLYFKIGQSQQSQLIRKHCEAILKQIQSENTYIPPQQYNQLGQICLQERDEKQALQYFQLSLNILLVDFRKYHPAIAQNFLQIGYCYLLQYQTRLSIKNFEISLEIYQNFYKQQDHKDLANINHHIALYYGRIGDYNNGLNYALTAYKMTEKLNKKENQIDLSFSKSRLAYFYLNTYQYQNALIMQEECLKSRLQSYDKTSILIAQTYLELGKILQAQNKPKAALEQYFLSIQLAYKSYKNNYHQTIGVALNLVSQCQQSIGDFEKAEYCQQYSIFVKIQNIQNLYHPYTATSYNYLGNLYLLQGKMYAGFRNIVFSYFLNLNCQDKSIKALSKYRLGKLYLKLGQPQKALKYISQSLKIYKQIYINHKNHIEVAKCYLILGLSQLQIGQEVEALENCKVSLEILKDLMNEENDFVTSDCLEGLGECYLKFKNYNNASKYFQKSYLIKKCILSDNHTEIALFLSKVSYLFESEGCYDLSLKWYKLLFMMINDQKPEISQNFLNVIVKIVICHVNKQFLQIKENNYQGIVLKKQELNQIN